MVWPRAVAYYALALIGVFAWSEPSAAGSHRSVRVLRGHEYRCIVDAHLPAERELRDEDYGTIVGMLRTLGARAIVVELRGNPIRLRFEATAPADADVVLNEPQVLSIGPQYVVFVARSVVELVPAGV